MPRKRSPLRCPICNAELTHQQIIPLGAVTADLPWELHAGRCPTHGWFQAEVISKPPREIFPVTQPGGVARRFTIDGKPAYAFPTVFNASDPFQRVDLYDPAMWAVDWSRMPGGTVAI
jgi:hypothetical protein